MENNSVYNKAFHIDLQSSMKILKSISLYSQILWGLTHLIYWSQTILESRMTIGSRTHWIPWIVLEFLRFLQYTWERPVRQPVFQSSIWIVIIFWILDRWLVAGLSIFCWTYILCLNPLVFEEINFQIFLV